MGALNNHGLTAGCRQLPRTVGDFSVDDAGERGDFAPGNELALRRTARSGHVVWPVGHLEDHAFGADVSGQALLNRLPGLRREGRPG